MRKTMMALLCMFAAIQVYAGNGVRCREAIPLTEDFSATVDGPCTVWYSAQTFDLPIKVCFTPTDPSSQPPEVEMDFTCTQGFYQDSILCSLFCKTGGSSGIDVEMPHKVVLTKEGDSYCVSMGKKYRDLLLQMGISYNVEVYVKVVYKAAGTLSMIPDTEFADCMDGGKFIKLGDTINIKANDNERYFVLPFVQWKEDSIRLIWTSTEPCVFAFASTCQFNTNGMKDDGKTPDGNVMDRPTILPNETLSYTADEVKYYAEFENAQAGMHYGRVSSAADGVLKIERIPTAPPDGGATLLHYDKKATVMANDTNALYAIPRSWTNATKFETPTNHLFHMYVGTNASFRLKDAIASYRFLPTDTTHWLGLPKEEMQKLWNKATSQYLYIRFQCTATTIVKPTVWYPSDCFINTYSTTINPHPEESKSITKESATIYSAYYQDLLGGDLSFKWNKRDACKTYISYDCSISTDASAENLLWYKEVKTNKVTIEENEIASWKDRIGDEGLIYFRFYTSATTGNMTISSTAPGEVDPTYPGMTISLVCEGEKVLVDVRVAQSIVVEDALGVQKDAWNATPGLAHELTLPAGAYILKGTLDGKTEKIQISIP